jgi:hypothetical protein
MAKKATKKKKAPAKKKSESIEVDAKPMSDAEAALLEMRQDMGIQEFEDPLKKDIQQLEQDTIALAKKKHENEVELSFHLYAIEERRVFAEHGWEKKDYYDQILGLSHNAGNEMANNVRMLLDMGLTNVKKLQGLSWGKVKQLRGLIKNGVIKDRKELEEWLKKCQISGRKALTMTDLQKEVKAAVAEKGKKELDKSRKTVKFDIEAYEMETHLTFEEIAMAELETEDRGRCYTQAVAEYASVHADAKDTVKHRHLGLLNLKETAERLAPVAVVFFPTTPGVTQKDLGVIPVYKVYQGFVNTGDEQELRHCIASTEKEAKKHLGVKEVREFDIEIAPSMSPREPFKAPEDPEALKIAKTSDPDFELSGLSSADLKKEIVKLVKASGISSTAYNKKKDEIKAELARTGKKVPLNEAIYAWLKQEAGE